MSSSKMVSSATVHTSLRKGFLVSTAMSLTFASSAFAAEPVVIDQDETIDYTAETLEGSPEALVLKSNEGGITADVSSTTATSTDPDNTLDIISLETSGRAIDATFGSITSTGTGQVFAVRAQSGSGDIDVDVGTIDLAGDFTAGVIAQSETGNISLSAESVNLAGTNLGDFGGSTGDGLVAVTGGMADVSIDEGHTDALYGSVAVAIGGEGARVESGSASTSGDQGVVLYAGSNNGDALVISGSIEMTGVRGAGIDSIADNGVATVESGTITGAGTGVLGIFARGRNGVDIASGEVNVGGVGIYGNSSEGTVKLVTTGDISSTNTTAIDLRGLNVDLTIGDGTTVSSTAPNSADNNGTYLSAVNVQAGNDATVTNNGLITAQNDAVALYVTGGGILNIDAGDVTQTGNSFAVLGRSTAESGATAVTINAGTVTGARGIRAETPNGADIAINTTGDITGTSGNAISISSQGGFTVTTAADTTITGNGTSVIAGGALGGSASVTNDGTVVGLGTTESGIGVTAQDDVTIVSNIVKVEGATAPSGQFKSGGINAASLMGGDISIASNSIEVGGQQRYGIAADTIGEGSISVTSGTITHEADEFSTIRAQTDSGAITIESGSIVNDGVSAKGIEAISQSGDVSITSESLINTAEGGGNVEAELFAEGIFANTGGAITIDSGLSEVYGFAASGIVALSASDISITAETTISHGELSQALYAGTRSGDVTITSTDVVSDLGSGIYGGSDAGDITINSGTAVAGLNGSGVIGSTFEGDVTITTGAITAGRFGVLADATDVASVDVQGDIAAGGNYDNGRLSYAVYARGDVANITTAEGTTSTGVDHGLLAAGQSGVTIDNAGTAAASAGTGSAIYATATGDISITSNSVVLSGEGADPGADETTGFRKGQGGIVASTDGAITIDSAEATVSGDHRFGIYAQSDGPIDVTSGSLTYEAADSSGIFILGGSGDVTVTSDTLISNGMSGSGVVARSGSGNITVDAGTTTLTAEGIFGNYTADAVFAQSNSGDVTITSQDASTAGYGGSAVVGIGKNVSINSALARTSGDNGVAVYGLSNAPGGTVNIDSQTIEMSGNDGAALYAIANNGGSAVVRVDDITATGETSVGIYASATNVDLTIDGDVSIGGNAVNLRSVGGTAMMTVNGSLSSTTGIGVSSFAQTSDITVSEGGSITAARAAIAVTNSSPGFSDTVYIRNEGSISGSAAVYSNPTQSGLFADVYMLNDGTLTGTSGYAVYTGAGSDTLELTERSVVNGVVDLGEGEDRLTLDFNDEAEEGAIGQVAASVNVEGLNVDTGTWRAETGNSLYDFIEIEEGAELIVAQVDGYLAVAAPVVELDGTLNLDLTSDTEAGELTGLVIAGAGSVVLSGPATLLVDDATGLQYTGGTFVENGTLLLTTEYDGDITTSGDGTFQLGTGGTDGDYTGNLTNNGTFVFNRSDDYEMLGDFNGSGSLVKDGEGTLYFGGAYGFTGTTTVLNGVIGLSGTIDPEATIDLSSGATFDLSQVSGGSATLGGLTGSGGTLVLGNTSVTVAQDGNTTFTGSLQGTGSFTKTGTGDLKLQGDSPNYVGEASVSGGTLSVNGNYSNATFVINSGGTLGGNGTLGPVTINGGTFAPGNSIDTITVAGNLVLDATSVYEVEVNAAGQNARANVTGTATLGGATVSVLAANGRYGGSTDYTILSAAGGLNGTFGSVTSNLAFLTPSLSYSGTDVTLTLARNDIDFAAVGANVNQKNVAAALESLGVGNAVFEEVLLLTDTSAQTGFQSATGELHPAVSSALVETNQTLRRQMLQAPSARANGAFGWGSMIGSFGGADATSNTTDLKTRTVGLMGGLGIGGGGFEARIGGGVTDDRFEQNGTADATSSFLIGQAGFDNGKGLSAKIGASYTWHDVETQRRAALGVIDNSLMATYDATSLMAYGQVDLLFPIGGSLAVGPTAGLSYVRTEVDGFSETGGALALTTGATERDVTYGSIGFKLEGVGAKVRPMASASWRHAWGDRDTANTFAFAGSSSFTTFGPMIEKDAAEVLLGLELGDGPVTASAGYAGHIGSEWQDHSGQITVQIAF